MAFKQLFLVVATASCAWGQRPFFAGTRPIGYPEMETQAPAAAAAGDLANRLGDDNVTTTTQRLPLEANGDRELVDRLSKMPVDKQPFWLINWQALEANRNNPQTYEIRPSHFAAPLYPTSAPTSSGSQSVNSGPPIANFGPPIVNPVPSNTNTGFQSNLNVNNPNTPSTNNGNNNLVNRNGDDNFDNFNANQDSTLRPVDNADANRFGDNVTPASTQTPNVDSSQYLVPNSQDNERVEGPIILVDKEPELNNNAESNDKKVPVAIPLQHETSLVQSNNPSQFNPLETVLFNSQTVNKNSASQNEEELKYGSSFTENKESTLNKNENSNDKATPASNSKAPNVHPVNPLGNVFFNAQSVDKNSENLYNNNKGQLGNKNHPFPYYPHRDYAVPMQRPSLGQRFGDEDYEFEMHVHPHYHGHHHHGGGGSYSHEHDYY